MFRPIPVVELPLVDVGNSNNFNCLYGVVSPDTSPISGVPYKLVILVKFPKSKLVTPFMVSTSLAFCKSLNVIAVFSISYPRTNALPGVHAMTSLSSDAVPPSSVVALLHKHPKFLCFYRIVNTFSYIKLKWSSV